MTNEEIDALVAEIADRLGCKYAYYTYYTADPEGTTPVPYLLFSYEEYADFYADNSNYASKAVLSIEYDTRTRSIQDERVIEAILKDHDLAYAKATANVTSQHVHEVMYDMEVMIDAD